MRERISNYINDNTFKFSIYENKIHIINFKRIITIEDNYISLTSNNKKITITGNNLQLNKLVDNELEATGIINKIEVNND